MQLQPIIYYLLSFSTMGNTYKSTIPMKSKKIKLGHSSYLPSCSSISSSNIEIKPQKTMKKSPSKKSKSYNKNESESILNPQILHQQQKHSQNDQQTEDLIKLSSKNQRVLRIVKKIIGQDKVDFKTQQILIKLILNPDTKPKFVKRSPQKRKTIVNLVQANHKNTI